MVLSTFWNYLDTLRTSLQPRGIRKHSPRRMRVRVCTPETLEVRTLLAANLVSDVNRAPVDTLIDPPVSNGAGLTFFVGYDELHGVELWKSDGTAGGTSMVLDIYPGLNSSSIGSITNVNGTIYFRANDGIHGDELWKTNGTAVGTVLVKDIASLPYQSSSPYELFNLNGTLFFAANDGVSGLELWKSDGTVGGTVLVADVNSAPYASSYPYSLTNVNGTLFFSAFDSIHGQELWKSDGTAAGTTLVTDIFSGIYSSTPNYLTNVNGTLFFTASDLTNGVELWKSDGTAGGTTMVANIAPSGGSSFPGDLLNVNGTLFFTADDGSAGRQVWKSDGTIGGTVVASALPLGAFPQHHTLTNVNGTVFFSAFDVVHGTELWKTDGTLAGSAFVADINPVPYANSYPLDLTNLNGTLYFFVDDGVHGRDLWKSDGTPVGTVPVKDLNPGTPDSKPSRMINANGTLYFFEDDMAHARELWKSDGTTLGTVSIKQTDPRTKYSNPADFTNVNGTLYFTATDPLHGRELWKSDGTLAGTVLVADLIPGAFGSYPDGLTNVNGVLFFAASDGPNSPSAGTYGRELWKSNGTSGGTVLVKDVNTTSPGAPSYPTNLRNVNGTLFFTADDGTVGQELWKSDGTAAGTQLVADINAGYGYTSQPYRLTVVNGTLFFTANDGVHGRELWKSDGTLAGTQLVADINPSTYDNFFNQYDLTAVNGTLFFKGNDGTHGVELWKSDGTGAGTSMLMDFNPGPNNSNLHELTNVNGTLFFSVDDGVHGTELWKSDGTPAGTTLVADIIPGPGTSSPGYFANVNGTLYFAGYDGINGSELWKSDGTAGGTVIVADIAPAGYNSDPRSITNLNGIVVFTAYDSVHGRELWKSDGTSAGTLFVRDIRPGTHDSNPGNLTVVGNTVFFSAEDGVHAPELWSFKNEAPTNITLSAATIPENQPVGVTLGAFSSADPDVGDTFTYTLVAGTGSTDNASFTIDGTGHLKSAISYDFETKSAYSIRVRTTDQLGLFFEKQFSISITNTNDAPVLNPVGSPFVTSIAEDDTANTGTLITDLIARMGAGRLTDQDAGALPGIAIIANDTANGSWQFRKLDTAPWTNVGSRSEAAALLLAADAQTRIRFVPNANYNGSITAALTFIGWDRTTGTAGSFANVGNSAARGGVTAYSSASDTASLTVTAVNDAPVLTAGTPVITAINEDVPSASNLGMRVIDLIAAMAPGSITDVDAGALQGIAVISASHTNGVWQFRKLDTAGWTNTTNVTPSAALILAADAQTRIRFVPNANFNGTVPLTFVAWDRSSGNPGAIVNASARGGTTPYSGATQNTSLTVNAVNDAPSYLSINKLTVNENTPNGVVGTLTSGDVDVGQTFTYSIQPGGNGAQFAISGNQLVVGATGLDFEAGATRTVTVRTTDQGGLFYDRTFTITLLNTNDAPVVNNTGTPTLNGIPMNVADASNTGTLISDLITRMVLSGITDQDAGALRGVAIINASQLHGTWQFRKTDVAPWTNIGVTPLSDTRGLLLASDATTRIRFVPAVGYTGTETISFRAWDRTTGSAGSVADTSLNGNTTAFSSAFEDATLLIS